MNRNAGVDPPFLKKSWERKKKKGKKGDRAYDIKNSAAVSDRRPKNP